MPGRRSAKKSWFAKAEHRYGWGISLMVPVSAAMAGVVTLLVQNNLWIAAIILVLTCVTNLVAFILLILGGSSVFNSRRVRIYLGFDQEDDAKYNRKAQHAASQ